MSEPHDEASGVPASAQPPGPAGVHDDDELANALAAQLLRFAPSGPIPIVRPQDLKAAADKAAAEKAAVEKSAADVAAAEVTSSDQTHDVPPDSDPVTDPGESAPSADAPVESGTPPLPAPAPIFLDAQRSPDSEDESPLVPSGERLSRPQIPYAPSPAVSDAPSEPPVQAEMEPQPDAEPGSIEEAPAGSALAQAEQLQAALEKIHLDDDAYREWEASLQALSPQSVPAPVAPAVTSAPGAVGAPEDSASIDQVTADEDRDDGDGEATGGSTPVAAPAPTGFVFPRSSLVPAAPGAADDAEGEPEHPHRQTFRPAPDAAANQPIDARTEERPSADTRIDAAVDDAPESDAADLDPAAGPSVEPDDAVEAPTLESAPTEELSLSERAAALRSRFDTRRQAAGLVPAQTSDDDHETDAENDTGADLGVTADSEAPSAFDDLLDSEPAAPTESAAPSEKFPFVVSSASEVPYTTGSIPLTTGSVPLTTGSVPLTTGSIPLDRISVSPVESTDTGSIPVFNTTMKLDVDLHDDIDDVAAPEEVLPSGISPSLPVAPAEPGLHTGPITPISTASLIGMLPAVPQIDDAPTETTEPEAETEPAGPPPRVERTGIEPTPIDLRIGRVARMFWLWVAPNSSVLTFGLGAVLIGSGISARQAILAAFAGLLLACIPLGLSTLASKRSGQPTAIVSRASFGLIGNVVPAVLLLGVRLFWIAVLLWLLATTFGALVFVSGYDLFVDPDIAGAVALALFGIGAALLATLGFRILARAQAVLAFIGALVAALVIGLTAPQIDFATIAEGADGDWLLVLGGAITVFSLLGTAWAAAGGDLARYQRPESSGAATVAATGLGAALPAGLLIGWGILLASSNEATSIGLQTDPITTLSGVLPVWYPLPLFFAITVSIVSGVATVAYSGGLTLIAVGLPMSRVTATIVVSVVGIAGGLGILFLLPSLTPVLLDLAPTIAVPVAAWAGIISAEMLIRRRGFDSESLLRRGGVYADVRWPNLIALVIITVLGLGFISGTQGWFVFEGYLWRLLGVDTGTGIGGVDLGVLLALVLGLLTPVAFGIRAIRRQEADEVDEVPFSWRTSGDVALEEQFVEVESVPAEPAPTTDTDDPVAR